MCRSGRVVFHLNNGRNKSRSGKCTESLGNFELLSRFEKFRNDKTRADTTKVR